MKNFTDLLFTVHPGDPGATQATFDFPNGFGISVITGKHAYTSPAGPYEVAVTLHGALCYDTPLTSDVLGNQTADDISTVMAVLATYPNHKE